MFNKKTLNLTKCSILRIIRENYMRYPGRVDNCFQLNYHEIVISFLRLQKSPQENDLSIRITSILILLIFYELHRLEDFVPLIVSSS